MTVLKTVIACGAMAMASFLAATPASAAFMLSNTNGGDGYVTGNSTSFDLFGSNDGIYGNLTGYTDVAAKTQSYIANYTYTTEDKAGSFYDQAGYYINGTLQRLSPITLAQFGTYTGVLRFRVQAGDTYGFYVASDGFQGRANIATTIGSDVPEAPTWAMLIAGFGLVGTVLRRRSGVSEATAA